MQASPWLDLCGDPEQTTSLLRLQGFHLQNELLMFTFQGHYKKDLQRIWGT